MHASDGLGYRYKLSVFKYILRQIFFDITGQHKRLFYSLPKRCIIKFFRKRIDGLKMHQRLFIFFLRIELRLRQIYLHALALCIHTHDQFAPRKQAFL